MLIPRKDRIAIYSYLFKEGVICTKDDVFSDKKLDTDANGNPVIVKNLYVIKLLQSLCSKGLVRKQYSWTWYYYFLTEAGVNYLREYLHLPSNVLPNTLQVKQESAAAQIAKEGYEDTAKPAYRREGGGFGRGQPRN